MAGAGGFFRVVGFFAAALLGGASGSIIAARFSGPFPLLGCFAGGGDAGLLDRVRRAGDGAVTDVAPASSTVTSLVPVDGVACSAAATLTSMTSAAACTLATGAPTGGLVVLFLVVGLVIPPFKNLLLASCLRDLRISNERQRAKRVARREPISEPKSVPENRYKNLARKTPFPLAQTVHRKNTFPRLGVKQLYYNLAKA